MCVCVCAFVDEWGGDINWRKGCLAQNEKNNGQPHHKASLVDCRLQPQLPVWSRSLKEILAFCGIMGNARGSLHLHLCLDLEWISLQKSHCSLQEKREN